MGEIADSMIDGTLDMYTGEYLGEGDGFPRTRKNNKIVPVHGSPYTKEQRIEYKQRKLWLVLLIQAVFPDEKYNEYYAFGAAMIYLKHFYIFKTKSKQIPALAEQMQFADEYREEFEHFVKKP